MKYNSTTLYTIQYWWIFINVWTQISQTTWMHFKYVEKYIIIYYYFFFSKQICMLLKEIFKLWVLFLKDINLKKWWNYIFKSVLIEIPCVNSDLLISKRYVLYVPIHRTDPSVWSTGLFSNRQAQTSSLHSVWNRRFSHCSLKKHGLLIATSETLRVLIFNKQYMTIFLNVFF